MKDNPIVIVKTEGLKETLADWTEVYAVFDEAVAGFAGEIIAGCPSVKGTLGIEVSEEAKTMDTVMEITRWLMECGASRKALVLAIGGGITTDMAGFAACIYKRGVAYANVPTTLLAQVDAAIGGKTGVNLDGYKNMLGVIRQPEFTYITPDVLLTLPERDFLSGAAELVKTFIIEDGGVHYDSAIRLLTSLRRGTPLNALLPELKTLILAAASVKAGVVTRDQFELGERKKLNLGHTFAHAIEHEARISGADITHGEAVAMGIIMAARLSEREGLTAGLSDRLETDFSSCGLPTDCPFPAGRLRDAMTKDKKAEGGIVHFVLIRSVGDVVFTDLDPAKI